MNEIHFEKKEHNPEMELSPSQAEVRWADFEGESSGGKQ